MLQKILSDQETGALQLGRQAFAYLIQIRLSDPIPTGVLLEYDFEFQSGKDAGAGGTGANWVSVTQLCPDLCYEGMTRLNFCLNSTLSDVVHGSCRKPHFPGKDALPLLDDLLANSLQRDVDGDVLEIRDRPDLLLMSGDQIYADDVAGPMLAAIHEVIALLGLPDERWHGATVNSAAELYRHSNCYYEREQLLPRNEASEAVVQRLFKGARKPIFTSASAKNHLISLSEVIAMYLLVWSPALWSKLKLSDTGIAQAYRAVFAAEKQPIQDFQANLKAVHRALAHIPVYMIFDDHDVTDDWNLTRGWEETAYQHPFSRRIIGNALVGYLIFQGWGNDPDRFKNLMPGLQLLMSSHQPDGVLAKPEHDEFINKLLDWSDWHYQIAVTPKILVLDTRTHRWRSERSENRPSGLMDWETLSDLQQELINHETVIMVSAAPVYGVKFIEAIQKIFVLFGQALMVDAENWMAHPGAANVMLNIFRHPKTPQHFLILSGDVHYSFFYSVRLRRQQRGPKISQITSSGIKNEFPDKLLQFFIHLNRALYGPRSPLNWFTRRRRMTIRAHQTREANPREVVNQSCLGRLRLGHEGAEVTAQLLLNDGEVIEFD
ncbi:peptide methionine sulfoxide reductase [Oleiphilus messinensis]|uniref:Peptide methionine sulfoxide reductase n=1 Tax=Oleiphilus messinensis TaxID=141451 RepID=A0A1Y0I9P0_9GAMM|nr:peptide methionine sulfoxide reductase [Oleiphilus messinensis]